MLKGIVYLISLRWVFSNNNANRNEATGTEVVNEVMSNERPFSFSEVVEPSNQTSISTQTSLSIRDGEIYSPNQVMDVLRYTFSDVASDSFDYETLSHFTLLIYSVIIPVIITHGTSYVLIKLNEFFRESTRVDAGCQTEGSISQSEQY